MFLFSKKSWFQLCVLSKELWLFLKNNRRHPFCQRHCILFWRQNSQSFTFANAISFSVFQNSSHRSKTSHWSSYIFRAASIIPKWQQPLEAALFLQKYFFQNTWCLKELLLSSNYFLVTNTFSDQLLLKDKYFFSTASVMFHRSYLFRISNYSKHVLFQRKKFLPTATF